MTPTHAELLARAIALQPLVREAAAEAESGRRLPESVAQAMAKEGLYRVGAPLSYGGAEAPPETQIEVIEAISYADGAAGWNLMIGIETFGLLGLAFPRGAELFAAPEVIVCSSTAAVGRADRTEGGYRVSGAWQFVSGCQNASYFAGMVAIHEHGEPVASELPRFAVLPRGAFEILETWHVAGLRGSGSHDVRVDDVLVPEEDLARAPGAMLAERRNAAPVLRIPMSVRLSYNKVAVGLGIARAAIDAFVAIATDKVPRFSSSTLRERPFAQRALARAEVRLRASRALLMEQVREVWRQVSAGEEISLRQRALFQIVCSDAAAACAEAVDSVVEAAGTSANFLDCPLERCARDVRVIRQHMTVAPHLLEDGGRVLLGLEPESVILKLLN
jgi:alkylation response protein AidB-like acyl-CoA dehydrogenase